MSKSKHKCPFCNTIGTKEELVAHVESNHEDMIPKDYSPARVVFNNIYHKDHGSCVVCKKRTEWNENTWRYNRLCGNKACREALRKKYQENMIKVYNTDNLLNNVEHQEKMLAHRKISGNYKFSDGGVRTYTGTFEQKTLEFMDKVLNIKSDEVMTPGPVFEYEYKGKKLHWITDILYIPANLVIEVKDGGSNPNNRPMKDYREKQVAKEQMITELGTYNYLRLTNNDFSQLLDILIELKTQMMDDTIKDKKALSKINEEVGGIPQSTPFRQDSESDSVYIIPYGMKNVLSGDEEDDIEDYGFMRSIDGENMLIVGESCRLEKVDKKAFLNDRKFSIYKFTSNNIKDIISELSDAYYNKSIVSARYLVETVAKCNVLSENQLDFDDRFKKVNLEYSMEMVEDVIETSMMHKIVEATNSGANDYIPLLDNKEIAYRNSLITWESSLDIMSDVNGYFIIDLDNGLRTGSHPSIKDITKEMVEEFLNIEYKLIAGNYI